MKTHEHAAQLAEALRGLFENCAMVHKHWGDGSNAREADAAQVDARAALAAWDKHNAPDYETRVRAYEAEGMTRSDAQAVADAEDQENHQPTAIILRSIAP